MAGAGDGAQPAAKMDEKCRQNTAGSRSLTLWTSLDLEDLEVTGPRTTGLRLLAYVSCIYWPRPTVAQIIVEHHPIGLGPLAHVEHIQQAYTNRPRTAAPRFTVLAGSP